MPTLLRDTVIVLMLAAGLGTYGSAQTNSSNPAVAGSQATNPQMPATGGRFDQQIQQEVTSELQNHDWAKDIHATTEDGIVTLRGSVPLYIYKERAYEKIHNKLHVQGVRNLIAVKGPEVPDTQLRLQLADKLRYDRIDRGIMFNNFELGVNNGVVTISGQARTPTDASSALSIIENTSGVKEVVDNINVLPASPRDDELRMQVARAIYSAGPLQKYALSPEAPIRIVVDRGHVTLYGVVDTPMDKQIADMQARSVPGVFSVTDKLAVSSQQQK
ncbi:MAG: BON domain-containing protein [Terriglobales bacterium]